MLLTIFTPAYNRADKIRRVFSSLEEQMNSECEWLVIDDGSKDNTNEVVSKFIEESSMNIRYYKKENGGKHTAHNMAVDLAKGKYFMCLDSDDYLENNSIEALIYKIKQCGSQEGIIAYKCDQNRTLLSKKFPQEMSVSNIYALNQEYNCMGEFVFVFPTELLKKNKFPVFAGERFLTESVLYDKMNCRMHLLEKVIEVCEYQTDGLSNNLNEIMKKNPAGYCMYFMQRIDMQTTFINRIITIGKYLCFCIFAGEKRSVYNGKYKRLLRLSYPLGIVMWLYYKGIRRF